MNRRKTKKLIQEDYEALYIGPEFSFVYRYAYLLNTLFICFSFSLGMPLLLIIALASIILLFFVDKFFCKSNMCFIGIVFSYYQRPALGDRRFAKQIVDTLKFAPLIHLGFSFIMISNKDIFQLDTQTFCSIQDSFINYVPFIDIVFASERFKYVIAVALFVAFFAIVLLLFILYLTGRTLLNILNSCCSCCCRKRLQKVGRPACDH